MAYELITKYTVPSNTASVSFNLPSTYKDIQIIVGGRMTGTAQDRAVLLVAYNGDTTNANYIRYSWYIEDGSNGTEYYTTSAYTKAVGLLGGQTSTSNTFYGLAKIWLNNYNDANNWTTTFSTVTSISTSARFDNWGIGNTWKNNAAITSIDFSFDTGNIQANSVFHIYGLK